MPFVELSESEWEREGDGKWEKEKGFALFNDDRAPLEVGSMRINFIHNNTKAPESRDLLNRKLNLSLSLRLFSTAVLLHTAKWNFSFLLWCFFLHVLYVHAQVSFFFVVFWLLFWINRIQFMSILTTESVLSSWRFKWHYNASLWT